MDDTLTTLSLEPMRMVTTLNRKSLGAQEKSGHHKVSGRNQEVSRVVRSARLCVTCQHLLSPPLGTCRTQILTTVQTLRQRITFSLCRKLLQSCHTAPNSALRFKTSCTTGNFIKSHFAVSAAKLAALFFANVKPPTSLVPCSSSRFWCWPTVHSPLKNIRKLPQLRMGRVLPSRSAAEEEEVSSFAVHFSILYFSFISIF